jgi:DNA-binding FadR family transcriptional regulator
MELLSLSVQADIEVKIQSEEWKENEKIPSERLLAIQYGVSRTVVRDALKRLTEKNLIVNRVGKGNYVSRPQESDVINLMGNAIEWSHIPIADIIDVREDMELLIARYSIIRISKEGIAKLEKLAAEMDDAICDTEKFSELDGLFHMAIAESGGNQVLKIFARTLNRVIDRKIIYGATPKTRQNAQREHKLMIKALQGRSLKMFEMAVKKHMACIRSHVYQRTDLKNQSKIGPAGGCEGGTRWDSF